MKITISRKRYFWQVIIKMQEDGGFETKRSMENAKAQALIGYAAHGCAGSAAAAWKPETGC